MKNIFRFIALTVLLGGGMRVCGMTLEIKLDGDRRYLAKLEKDLTQLESELDRLQQESGSGVNYKELFDNIISLDAKIARTLMEDQDLEYYKGQVVDLKLEQEFDQYKKFLKKINDQKKDISISERILSEPQEPRSAAVAANNSSASSLDGAPSSGLPDTFGGGSMLDMMRPIAGRIRDRQLGSSPVGPPPSGGLPPVVPPAGAGTPGAGGKSLEWYKQPRFIKSAIAGSITAAVLSTLYLGLKWYQKKRISKVVSKRGLMLDDFTDHQQNIMAAALLSYYRKPGAFAKLQRLITAEDIGSMGVSADMMWQILAELYYGKTATEQKVNDFKELVNL